MRTNAFWIAPLFATCIAVTLAGCAGTAPRTEKRIARGLAAASPAPLTPTTALAQIPKDSRWIVLQTISAIGRTNSAKTQKSRETNRHAFVTFQSGNYRHLSELELNRYFCMLHLADKDGHETGALIPAGTEYAITDVRMGGGSIMDGRTPTYSVTFSLSLRNQPLGGRDPAEIALIDRVTCQTMGTLGQVNTLENGQPSDETLASVPTLKDFGAAMIGSYATILPGSTAAVEGRPRSKALLLDYNHATSPHAKLVWDNFKIKASDFQSNRVYPDVSLSNRMSGGTGITWRSSRDATHARGMIVASKGEAYKLVGGGSEKAVIPARKSCNIVVPADSDMHKALVALAETPDRKFDLICTRGYVRKDVNGAREWHEEQFVKAIVFNQGETSRFYQLDDTDFFFETGEWE